MDLENIPKVGQVIRITPMDNTLICTSIPEEKEEKFDDYECWAGGFETTVTGREFGKDEGEISDITLILGSKPSSGYNVEVYSGEYSMLTFFLRKNVWHFFPGGWVSVKPVMVEVVE